MSSIKEGFKLPGASWNFNGEKLARRSLQMAVKMAPMDPARPKTPGWAFTAPQSAKR
jgi:hypothetical protein